MYTLLGLLLPFLVIGAWFLSRWLWLHLFGLR
jgi:hypothetical protein